MDNFHAGRALGGDCTFILHVRAEQAPDRRNLKAGTSMMCTAPSTLVPETCMGAKRKRRLVSASSSASSYSLLELTTLVTNTQGECVSKRHMVA